MGGRNPFLVDRYPAICLLDVGSLDGRPSDAVSNLFLPNVTRVSCKGVVERGAIDVLRMRRKVIADRWRQIDIATVRQGNGFPR